MLRATMYAQSLHLFDAPPALAPSAPRRLLHRLAVALLRPFWIRQGRRELEGLDERMLSDIGLHRSEIEAALRGDLRRSSAELWPAVRRS